MILFLGLALVAIFFAVGMLLSENAVHSAMFLIGNFGCVAVLYLMLNAPFIGMVQIAVYAGAIMVLFLFVIMLLGAEQTTDTSRRFSWLTGAATVLGMSFLSALAIPVLASGFSLPRPTATETTLRFVHAAGIPNDVPLNITISGGQLGDPMTISGATFSTVTDFMEIVPGTYNVLLQGADGSPIAPPSSVTINAGEKLTAVVYGEVNLDVGSLPQIATIAQSAAPTGDGVMRLLVFNTYSDAPVSLVDLGPNEVVDLRNRPQLDDAGQPVLDANGQPVLTPQVSDVVIARDVARAAQPVPVIYDAGTHQLAFVDAAGEILTPLPYKELPRDTEYLVILGPDYQEFLGSDSTYRPFVLRADNLLVTTPAPLGSPASIGQLLFVDYVLPVNVVGILLLVALVGVVVLTRPDNDKADRRVVRRRKVSRPLTSVIATQTGGDVVEETPKLPTPQSGD